MAGALGVAPGAVAAVPVPAERGGAIVQVEETQTQVLGTEGESYTAISTPYSHGAYAVRADDRTLERINSNGSASYDIPPELATEPIRSLDSSSNRVAVLTDDGLPHVWGPVAAFVTAANAGMASTTLLGGTGDPAEATQITVAGTYLVGVLLADGRVGVFSRMAGSVDLYRVLDAATLPEKVVQIEGFGAALVLRLENGGVLIWDSGGTSGTDPQGTITVPASPELAGRPSGPADKLLDIQVNNDPIGDRFVVGVTEAGKVYAESLQNGTPYPESGLPAVGDREGKAVEAAVVPGNAGVGVFLVRTDQNKLYLYSNNLTVLPGWQAEVDGLDLTGKEVVSVTGGTSFQLILADEVIPPLAVDADPTIASSGDLASPKVGDTLTGTPATFNATEGVTLTNQWLADGAEIEDATGTTFTLTSAQVDKDITFRTTAVRDPESIEATSDPVGPVKEPVVVTPPIPGPTPECLAANAAASAAQAALGASQAKVAKAKAKFKKAKKAHKPAKKVKKLKKKFKKAKKAQKAAAATSAIAASQATAACS
ncbi:hypothetical protein [Nocardioides sp. L-11A]|uniref:hypothetical protein n=1 Tax=Nocardioides sp. L-11A TaxID=3043848 RepID=UPI00249BE5DA|nr:hypothetical protein QJ852_17025 [Nocardioides sp. L-11A]